MTYMTVLIPDSCWNIWRPQPTKRALRVGPWLRIRKITRPPKNNQTNNQMSLWHITNSTPGSVFDLISVCLYSRLCVFRICFHLHPPLSPLPRCWFWWCRTLPQSSGLLLSYSELDEPPGPGPSGEAIEGSLGGRRSRRTAALLEQWTDPTCTCRTGTRMRRRRRRRREGRENKQPADSASGLKTCRDLWQYSRESFQSCVITLRH